jgi:hypothetical protein
MFKKATYELSDLQNIESTNKVYDRKIGFKNLLKIEFYLLFVFTIFASIIGITIFVGCLNLKNNYESGINYIEQNVNMVENYINNIPVNVSNWINQQSNNLNEITNDIVLSSIETPSNFINSSINEFVDNLNIILGGSLSRINMNLTIPDVVIPNISLYSWTLDIPVSNIINMIDVFVNIPFYFGIINFVISILFFLICVVKGLVLYFDIRFKFKFLCKTSFWIGIIFGFLFLLLTILLITVHFIYVDSIGNQIENTQQYIEEKVKLYNNFIDTNEVIIENFVSDNINVMVNISNKMIDELKNSIEDNINRILSSNINLPFDKINLINIFLNLDNLKIKSIFDISWINQKIQSIFVGLIVISSFFFIFFALLIVIACCEQK